MGQQTRNVANIRMTRDEEIKSFLAGASWGDAERRPLAGDASARRYERILGSKGHAVLMDAPPEPGEVKNGRAAGYSAVAHLAVDCLPFVALAERLRNLGLSAPKIFAEDVGHGLILLEDFGDDLFVSLFGEGEADPELERELYGAAVDVLLALHQHKPLYSLPGPSGTQYEMSSYDDGALKIETDLVIDWYLPGLSGAPETPKAVRKAYQSAWQSLYPLMADPNPVLCLRDFHAGNLIWLPDRQGPARIGLLDFQDALIGSRAYDLVSLLQDARRDIRPALETEMLDRYIAGARALDPEFDEAAYRMRYALLGAQRNSKIVGIFMRLWLRDGKKTYLPHLPRVWRSLERNLTHPSLNTLKAWFDEYVPRKERLTVPDPEAIAGNVPKVKVGAAG